jgi:hypothetical protein
MRREGVGCVRRAQESHCGYVGLSAKSSQVKSSQVEVKSGQVRSSHRGCVGLSDDRELPPREGLDERRYHAGLDHRGPP